MKNTNISIKNIQEDLENLDTEYREALAKALMDLKYINKSPLEMSMGTEEEKEELDRVYNKDLRPYQIEEIIRFISKEMKEDFQFEEYKPIEDKYLKIAEDSKEKKKPKCALIGHDGNIFNLMGIASRTLKHNGMQEEYEEMVNRITNSHSYYDAIAIIGEYVDISDNEYEDDDEEDYEDYYDEDNEYE